MARPVTLLHTLKALATEFNLKEMRQLRVTVAGNLL
jgi:hypothetical protein